MMGVLFAFLNRSVDRIIPIHKGGHMHISGPDHLMDRRGFLKKGMQAGALVVSYPVWKHFAGKEPDALQAAGTAAQSTLDKDTLRKLLEACLSRGGEFAEVYYERSVTHSPSLAEDKITTATRGLDMGA